MNTVEDRLRAATQAAAHTVPPGSAPRLHLPGLPRASRRRRLARLPGSAVWLAPLAAAAAVTAVIAAVVVVSGVLGHGQTRQRSHTAIGRTITAALAPAPPTPAGIPAYDVALAPGLLVASHATHVVVRATATGTVLATVRPPPPYGSVIWVTGASDDRTFVLAAQPWQQPRPAAGDKADGGAGTRLFLLRLDPAARVARLTALPIRGLPANMQADGIALAPGGGKLAAALSSRFRSVIAVFGLASGTVREWRGVLPGRNVVGTDLLGGNPLSWAADGRTLAFDAWGPHNVEVRLLDTAAPGASLPASRPVLTFRDWATTGSVSGSAIITPDGTRIAAMQVVGVPVATDIRVREFSVRTGRQLAVLVSLHYRKGAITGWPNVLWASPSGSALIISTTRLGAVPGKNGGLTPEEIGAVVQGRFAPLPGIPDFQKPVW